MEPEFMSFINQSFFGDKPKKTTKSSKKGKKTNILDVPKDDQLPLKVSRPRKPRQKIMHDKSLLTHITKGTDAFIEKLSSSIVNLGGIGSGFVETTKEERALRGVPKQSL